MSPPSRGKWNEGALTPSARAERETGAAPAFSRERFEVSALKASVFAGLTVAALAFDPGTVDRAVFAELDNFNAFDGGLWDASKTALSGCLFFAFLPGLFAGALRDLEAGLFADAAGRARVVLPMEDLGDLLRVFLDIRLPFVAFRGSIIGVLRQAGIKPTGQV